MVENKIIMLFLLFNIVIVNAQEQSEYQRVSIEMASAEIKLEGVLSYYTANIEGHDAYLFRPQFDIEYNMKHHSFGVVLPYDILLLNNQEAEKQVYNGIEDITVYYDFLKPTKSAALSFGGFVGLPLFQEQEELLNFGSGRYTMGFKFAVAGIKDPILWNAGIQYGIGLPKEEQNTWSWQPGNIRGESRHYNII